jgi:hypothetical protein
LAVALLLAGTAHGQALRVADLPEIRRTPPPMTLQLKEHEERSSDNAFLLLSLRAQQLADPHGRPLMFAPIVSGTFIGGSLRFDF